MISYRIFSVFMMDDKTNISIINEFDLRKPN